MRKVMYVQSYIKHEHLQQLLGNPLFLKLLDSLKVGTSLTDNAVDRKSVV